MGVIDEVLSEPAGGNNWAPIEAGNTLKAAIERHLNELLGLSKEQLLGQRYEKFRVLGKFIESNNFEEIQEELPQITE